MINVELVSFEENILENKTTHIDNKQRIHAYTHNNLAKEIGKIQKH